MANPSTSLSENKLRGAPWTSALMLATLALLLVCAGSASAAGEAPAEATFVFVGTVVEAGGSTLAQLPASSQTYIVQVDEVLLQRGTFDDQGGQRVTVVAEGGRLGAGDRYLFHTEPFMFGASVAVRAIDVESADQVGAQAAEAMRTDFELQAVRQRVEQAGLIVSGMVTSVRQVRQPRLESEHLPDLRQAVVKVDSVLKGDVSGEEVSFLFAASRDVHYVRAPKFQEGDAGIFMLNAGTRAATAMKLGTQELTMFDAQDFLPSSMLEAIQTMAQ